jgi:hypothetical protein
MSHSVAGSCFGFEVRSPLPFAFLRGGGGDPLEVVPADEGAFLDPGKLIFDWRPSQDQPLDAKLYGGDGSYALWVADGGWFGVDLSVPRITVLVDGDAVRREIRLWGIPALLCFAARGDVPLHAAAVEVDGGAVLLAGPRTRGKTTLAAGFMQEGHRLLAEDLACIRVSPGPAILPGPAMLRVRHDVAAQLSLPTAAAVRVGRDDDRVHLALDQRARGNCSPVPLRAIILLRPGDDGLRLTPVPAVDAVRDIWELGFRLPGSKPLAASFESVADLISTVPIWNLHRPLVVERLPEVVAKLAAVV